MSHIFSLLNPGLKSELSLRTHFFFLILRSLLPSLTTPKGGPPLSSLLAQQNHHFSGESYDGETDSDRVGDEDGHILA